MHNDYCVAPELRGGVPLLMALTSLQLCNAIVQIFLLDEDGVIHHKCSKKVIGPEGD